jgi:hypothetical protein
MSGPQHSALVRGDDGGLHVRRFASGDAARAASAAREITPEDVASIAGPTAGLMRASAFAAKVGVSPRTVRRMYARGALPGAREDGPHLLKVPVHLLRLATVYGLRGVERMAAAGLLPGRRA